MRVCVIAASLLLAWAAIVVSAQQQQIEAVQDLSLVEVGSAASINAAADGPLQAIAHLLVEANDSVNKLRSSRQPLQVLHNDINLHTHTNIVLARKARKAKKKNSKKVTAEMRARLEQPTVHDAQRFGTKYPIDPKKTEFVTAAVVGEDGKPYVPRKGWSKIQGDKKPNLRSPFAKFVFPPAVGAAADVVNKDANTKLTSVELKSVKSIQFRLKGILDQLGANIVWDHTPVKNRRVITEFENLKAEARALMEEYELRTGVKTIAWQLGKPDFKGLELPNGSVKDIYFASNPELRRRKLQRRGDRKYPPPPTAAMKQLAAAEKAAKDAATKAGNEGMKKQEQLVDVGWRRDADTGIVKAKIKLKVIDSKVPQEDAKPVLGAREPVEGKLYPSGRRGSPSRPVSITVVAPKDEMLTRTEKDIAKPFVKPEPESTTTAPPAPSMLEMNL